MLCEGGCGRSFRNGDKVYSLPTRVVVVDNRGEHVTDVHAYYCAHCFMGPLPRAASLPIAFAIATGG